MSHNDYRQLKSFKNAQIIFDVTFAFTKKYIDYKSRTRDQMEQAARSGKQNIAEGCKFGLTSKNMEVKLLNSSRASFEELLCDYEDFLRVSQLKKWDKNDSRAIKLRGLITHPSADVEFMECIKEPELTANAMITLINQTNFLLDKQMKAINVPVMKNNIWFSKSNIPKNTKEDDFMDRELDYSILKNCGTDSVIGQEVIRKWKLSQDDIRRINGDK